MGDGPGVAPACRRRLPPRCGAAVDAQDRPLEDAGQPRGRRRPRHGREPRGAALRACRTRDRTGTRAALRGRVDSGRDDVRRCRRCRRRNAPPPDGRGDRRRARPVCLPRLDARAHRSRARRPPCRGSANTGCAIVSVALAYSLIGDRTKPLLVMSSSLGTTRAMWDSQQTLQSDYSLLLYDHRGHGESPAPEGPYSIAELAGDVIALLDTLGAGAVAFCGLSLGGMVGLWLAAHRPERIDRLVVMSTLARLEP